MHVDILVVEGRFWDFLCVEQCTHTNLFLPSVMHTSHPSLGGGPTTKLGEGRMRFYKQLKAELNRIAWPRLVANSRGRPLALALCTLRLPSFLSSSPLLTIINQLHQFALTVANNTCSNPLHLVRRAPPAAKKGKSLGRMGQPIVLNYMMLLCLQLQFVCWKITSFNRQSLQDQDTKSGFQ